MTNINDKLHQYATGTAKGCQHPINKVMPVNDYKDVCVLCGKMFVMAFHEKDFDPATMNRATQADIDRIWRELWGDATVLYILGRFNTDSSEAIQETTDCKSLIIYAKDRQIAELTRMLFALGKQDGQTIRNLTEENRDLRQMLHMEPR